MPLIYLLSSGLEVLCDTDIDLFVRIQVDFPTQEEFDHDNVTVSHKDFCSQLQFLKYVDPASAADPVPQVLWALLDPVLAGGIKTHYAINSPLMFRAL